MRNSSDTPTGSKGNCASAKASPRSKREEASSRKLAAGENPPEPRLCRLANRVGDPPGKDQGLADDGMFRNGQKPLKRKISVALPEPFFPSELIVSEALAGPVLEFFERELGQLGIGVDQSADQLEQDGGMIHRSKRLDGRGPYLAMIIRQASLQAGHGEGVVHPGYFFERPAIAPPRQACEILKFSFEGRLRRGFLPF